MPVITIHALPPPHPEAVDTCLSAAAQALAEATQDPPQGVWAHWVEERAMHTGPLRRDWKGHCPIVIIRARAGRDEETIQAGLSATAAAIARALDLPLGDIWIHWEELQPGRVFAGGAMR